MLTAASVRPASPGDLRLLLLRPQRPVPADLRALDQAQPRTLGLRAELQHHRQVATDTPPGYRYLILVTIAGTSFDAAESGPPPLHSVRCPDHFCLESFPHELKVRRLKMH